MRMTFRSALVPALLALSCSREPVVEPTPALVHHVITAHATEPEAKTVLNPEQDTKVLWTAHEQVAVFPSLSFTPYLFTGTNDATAASASFEGDTPEPELGTYVLLSPYDANALGGSEFTTTLPPIQEGVAGTFAHGTAIMAGLSSGSSVACKHVCSGMRFQVAASNIAAVSFRGNGNEKIGGKFRFHFDGAGNPEILSTDGGQEVVLHAPGGTFTPATWYYITLLPTAFSHGFTVTAMRTDGYTATYVVNSAVTFSRGKFKNKANLDENMSWTAITPATHNTCYGPANAFCLRPGGSVNVDVAPRLILPGWLRSALPLAGAPVPDSYAILWNNGETVRAELSGTTLTLSADTKEGTALVAIKKDDTILWSFLVWVTASAPAETTLPGGAVIQEALGGELFFQWGRKDPLREGSFADNQDDNGLRHSIQNPTKYINKGNSVLDWYTDTPGHSDATLWGNENSPKTVWDPCPQGWRVPPSSAFTGLENGTDYGFRALGFLTQNGLRLNLDMLYWTAGGGTESYSRSLSIAPDPVTYSTASSTRDLATPIRCVKE